MTPNAYHNICEYQRKSIADDNEEGRNALKEERRSSFASVFHEAKRGRRKH
jgi:hypothetical protein